MARDVILSTRIPADLKAGLAELAAATDRPIAWHVTQALASYFELNRWHVTAIKEGLAQARQGIGVPLEDVERWVKSWGTPNELPMPSPRKHAPKR